MSQTAPPRTAGHSPLIIALLLMLCVVSPLLFGVPIRGLVSAQDSNFALQLVHAYVDQLHSGRFFPRWMPGLNDGFGSPVFYFYGRLPYLLCALFALCLHGSVQAALMVSIGVFRLLAFFTCRAWLRRWTSPFAADCGALTYMAMPFAMLYNPIGRFGYAETAATAFLPLLFLVLDRRTAGWRAAALDTAALACIYAILAATHLPQTLLAIGVASLYALLLGAGRSLAINIGGVIVGLLLSAPSVYPALAMQRFINPEGWTDGRFGDVRQQFLFTTYRVHTYHFTSQELYLHGTWLLCAAILLPFLVAPRFRAAFAQRRSRAALICLLLSLLAMTKVFYPMWAFIPQLRALQFPWRLFPLAIALTGAAVALLVTRAPRWQNRCLAVLAAAILAESCIPAAGAFVSLSHTRLAARVPKFIVLRLPSYVHWSQRETHTYDFKQSIVPEYIPRTAHDAGWHIVSFDLVLPHAAQHAGSSAAQTGLLRSATPGGAIRLQGTLPAPASVLLPTFFFPDARLTGAPPAAISLDAPSGLLRVALPAGPIAVQVDHDRPVPGVQRADLASLAGLLLLLALAACARFAPAP